MVHCLLLYSEGRGSVKYNKFVQEAMDDKDVEVMPGINSMLGCRLRQQGFCKVGSYYDRYDITAVAYQVPLLWH